MPTPSHSRRHAREAAIAACDGRRRLTDRQIAAQLAIAHAMLELAHQVGRLADQVPVYGPPEDSSE